MADVFDHGLNEAVYDHGTRQDYLNKREEERTKSESKEGETGVEELENQT